MTIANNDDYFSEGCSRAGSSCLSWSMRLRTPAVASGPTRLVPLAASAARANLVAWAQAGITLVRDVGSAGGLTLHVGSGPGMPALQAAGTDVTGSISREVALLAQMALEP